MAKVVEPPLATGMDIAGEDETAAGAVSAATAAYSHLPRHVVKPWPEEPDAGNPHVRIRGSLGDNPRGDPTPPRPDRSILLMRQEAGMERRAKVELFEQIRSEYEFRRRGRCWGWRASWECTGGWCARRCGARATRGAKKTERRAGEDGGVVWVHRWDPGSRPEGATEAAAYGDSGSGSGRGRRVAGATVAEANGSAVRARAQARTWVWLNPDTFVPQSYELGRGSAGGLV